MTFCTTQVDNPDLGTADYVDKTLRGMKLGAITAGQPTEFDLVVNLTTARALVLKIPRAVPATRHRVNRMRLIDVRYWHDAAESHSRRQVR